MALGTKQVVEELYAVDLVLIQDCKSEKFRIFAELGLKKLEYHHSESFEPALPDMYPICSKGSWSGKILWDFAKGGSKIRLEMEGRKSWATYYGHHEHDHFESSSTPSRLLYNEAAEPDVTALFIGYLTELKEDCEKTLKAIEAQKKVLNANIKPLTTKFLN